MGTCDIARTANERHRGYAARAFCRSLAQKVVLVSPLVRSRLPDPARDAARLLGWFGFAVLMVGAPLVGVLSRHALLILLPVGAGILAAAATVSLPGSGLRPLRDALRNPIGLAALFLAFWSVLSLVWTLSPGQAGPRCAATLAVAVLAVLIVANLPERPPRGRLYLLPAGLTVTAVATLGMAWLGPRSFRGGTEFDPSLLERSVLTLVVLVWPALGALCVFRRWRLAAALACLVAVAVTASLAPLAMAVFAVGAVSFAHAVDAPRRAARNAALAFGTLIVVAPVLPFLLAPLAHLIPLVGRSTVAAMTDWRDIVAGEPLRLVTGHGLDSARRGVVEGLLPAHTPRSILFEIWYDLGVLGAVAFALVFALALDLSGNAASGVAPCLLAGMVATLTVAVFGIATAQTWFVTLAGLQAIALGVLARSSRSGARPAAALRDPAGAPSRPAPFVAASAPRR